jgi:two-component system NtrC family sensor kinase
MASMLARTDRMSELLPVFHQQALQAAGGTASVVLRLHLDTSQLHPESAAGLQRLDGAPWLADRVGQAAADRCWTERAAVVVCGLADVKARLHAEVAVIAPLVAGAERLGLLLVTAADDTRAQAARPEIGAIAELMGVALERARLRREAELGRDLAVLTTTLSGALSSSPHLAPSLEEFCDRAARIFRADKVSIWLHDRRARVLDLVASSDGAELAASARLPIDDEALDISQAMRWTRAAMIPPASGRAPDVLAPLRGRRRAVGTLELRGVQIDPGGSGEMIDRVDEVARRLSASIENVWLLDELVRSRRELESTFNSLTDLVIVSDGALCVTQANRAFAARVGRQPHELVSHPLVDFFGRDVGSWIERCSGDVHTIAPDDESREIADEKLNGTFLFTLSPLIGYADQRIGTVIVARDVTAQARLEAERVELRNRLAQSEKLAALGQFVAGIAHELNNPLQGVLGHVELMLHEGGAASRFRRELKLVFREADRAAKIVHNLLVFAGSRRITRRRLNANNIVEKVLTLRAPACAAASITIVKDLSPRLPRVAGDALLLQQAILNIVLNAEQAMAGIGAPRKLEVRTRAVKRHRIEIEIADSGPGIPPEALPRLFEPFFTTKEVGQGTGLGLAIAYGVAQEHGGHLQATNRDQGGAIFTLVLPVGFADAVE